MTIQTKYFIEVSDIVSLRIECKHCASSLLLPLSKDIDLKSFRQCPNCTRGWTRRPEDDLPRLEPIISEVISSLQKLNRLLNGEYPFPIGCDLTLEIKAKLADPDPTNSR